jgi:chromosome segregation ATPase
MNISRLRFKTLIAILCCLLIVGSFATTQAKFWEDPWYVNLWNIITGLKDTLEGIDALLAAFDTEIKEIEDEIARQNNRKLIRLELRNKAKEKILPAEQEQSKAKRLASHAHTKYHDAKARAETLRDEIADLTKELRWVSLDDPRHDEILASLAEKNSSLSAAEDEKSAAKKVYNTENNKAIRIWYELKPDRDYIANQTSWINTHDRKIDKLNDKITKLREKIKAEKKRRKKVEENIEKEEKKWEELEEKSKEPQI